MRTARLFRRVSCLMGVLTALAQSPANAEAQGVRIGWMPDPQETNRLVVEVSGLPQATVEALRGADRTAAQWHDVLVVVTETGDVAMDLTLPPMEGSYESAPGVIRFKHAFPAVPGLTYRAIFHPDALPGSNLGEKALSATFRVPKKAASPSTIVRAIYPSAATLPENILKFYLHFSAPMSRGHIYDHIQLRGADGARVELPFLEIDEELWDPAMTRLTLFLDPGRIKRGVRPLEEVGPSLEPGKSYTLFIDTGWLDGAGQPLLAGFSKKFTVAAADRSTPDPADWKLKSPAAASRGALEVRFPEPLDRALVERFLQVKNADGRFLKGEVSVGAEEMNWSFVPDQPWEAGTHHLVIPKTIEDLAGNNIGKLFDVDLQEKAEPRTTNQVVTLDFSTR